MGKSKAKKATKAKNTKGMKKLQASLLPVSNRSQSDYKFPWVIEDEWEIDFVKDILQQSDRASAIMAVALLERTLEYALTSRFVSDDKSVVNCMFDFRQGGPFSSLSAKINGAFAFGLIGKVAKKDLDKVREIRNDFSHWKPRFKESITFETESVRERCNNLQIPKRSYSDQSPPKYARDKYLLTISVCCRMLYTEATTFMPERPKVNKPIWDA